MSLTTTNPKTKIKVVFRCQECGYASSKWLGRCPDCSGWNTFTEERVSAKPHTAPHSGMNAVQLKDAAAVSAPRITTGIGEFDTMLGGGMVSGSLILLGGAPGIGKSTILLQLAALCNQRVLYVSGEESLAQIKLRTDRLNIASDAMFILCTNNCADVENAITSVQPQVVIIDSIQTIAHPFLESIAGSVGQIREVTARLMEIAKQNNIVVFLAGHVTKEGTIAGPKILEHIVDVVLYFEDEKGIYRIIRSFKNRFGTASEIAVFEMTSKGLAEVDNPDSVFFLNDETPTSGTVLTTVVEGTRPLIVELQALVSRTGFGIARRQATGMDFNRLVFLIAVIEKRLGISLADQDIFVNIVGGMKVKEPAIDCAIVAAILSSFFDVSIPPHTVFIGEVGLGGEIRDVPFTKERLLRAEKMGITECIIAPDKKRRMDGMSVRCIPTKHIKDVMEKIK